jgi:predicted phosphodiesterase
MRYLVISDIHSNREALEAVLADAAEQFEQIVCCGDLVGYGADPNRVVEWARGALALVVRGNHDKTAAGIIADDWFNAAARAASGWTAQALTPENRKYLADLPKGPALAADFALVHGSPADEDEYVADPEEARQAFAYVERMVTFFGHTHLQGGFRLAVRRLGAVTGPGGGRDAVRVILEPDTWYLINPGSAGQPRDHDPRAAYALYDTELREVEFRRIAYDIATTQQKIRAAGLPEVLAARLDAGR